MLASEMFSGANGTLTITPSSIACLISLFEYTLTWRLLFYLALSPELTLL
jgi:hypothetical protein